MTTVEDKTKAKVDITLDKHTLNIWAYVRENKNSLDSERARKLIREGFDDAVADVRAMIHDVAAKNTQLRAEIKNLREDARRTKKENAALRKRADSLAMQLDREQSV